MSRYLAVVISALHVVAGSLAVAQVNDFGVGGILDIPTSRMAEEGVLTTTYSRKDVADIYAIGYQALPRLEASFRYSIFNARKKSPVPGTKCEFGTSAIYGCDDNRDRSFEIKYRLLDESTYFPELSIGIRDLLGTGVWSGEYISASKRFGNLDASLSIGWGRFAERAIGDNPLASLDGRFSSRTNDFGLGGTLASGSLFRGEKIGLFGGIRYLLPDYRLALVAAYNSDSYARERNLNTIADAEPLSVGLEWAATPGVELSLSRQQGNQWGFRVTASLDTSMESPRKPPVGFGESSEQLASSLSADSWDWWAKLAADAEASGLLVREAAQTDSTLRLRYANRLYQVEADAVRRVLELVELYAPPSVTRVELTGESLGMPTHVVVHTRRDPESSLALTRSMPEIKSTSSVEAFVPDRSRNFRYPNGELSVGIHARGYLFDPDFPLLYQLAAKIRSDVDFGGGLGGTFTWSQSLSDQFERIQRDGNSALPPVRTQLKRYLQEGKSGIDELVLVKRGTFSPDVFYQVYGGVLEEMYSGVGGEVLWSPAGSLSFGVNLNGVVQREFDKKFGHRNYKTITGHASAYWATPFHDFDLAIHVGRYLARDIGATFEVQKRFANGWSVGAFATLTNVPFAVFGEGSFDKGLIFRIPFDLYSPRNTRGAYRTILRSINRDGGRMLDNWPGGLWEGLRSTRPGYLEQTRHRMVPAE